MITFKGFIFKGLSKSFENNITLSRKINNLYQNNVDNLDYNRCVCNKCGSKGNFNIHGYYHRYLLINNERILLRITRVKCLSCSGTDAIFFEDIIPYYQLSSLESKRIILADFIDFYYDYSVISSLKRRVNLFNKYLKILLMNIMDDIHEINLKSIVAIKKSFLQIHKGNISLET